jgi:ABC-type Zn uptake system ZnuABC Zn-binding protein ZnuA
MPPSVRRPGRVQRLPAVLILSLLLAAGGCGRDAPDAPGAANLNVVATIAPIVDLAQRVAGDRVQVKALIPPGENGHTYQPRPGDGRMLTEADLFIDPGFGLNQLITQLTEVLPKDATRLMLGEVAVPKDELISETQPCHFGHCHDAVVNGHLWTNPRYAVAFAEHIASTLTRLDPPGRATYEANATRLSQQIEELDGAFQQALDTIPAANRKMVVYHNAWAYFARRYDLRLVGAIQPNDFAEPSASEVRAMIAQIKAERVPAFFGSEVFPSDVLETVAEETKAKYVKEISDDRLPGNPGDPANSYAGMMVVNVRTIVTALGGTATALDGLETKATG